MKTTRSAAALLTCLGLCTLAAPSLADEPAKPGSAPVNGTSAPLAAPAPTAPTTGTQPATGTSPATGNQPSAVPSPAQAPYPYPAPPPGYGPAPGYPQGYYPPPGGYPPPGYAPRGYGPPPGYYPYSRHAPPVRVDGAKADDYKLDTQSAVAEEDAGGAPSDDQPLTPKQRRRRSTIFMASGGGALGGGWLLSVAHGLIGEIAGISCTSGGGWDFVPSCSQNSHYAAIYIPVVGPIIEAATHQGNFTGLDMMGVVLETALQVGGLTMFAVGVSMRSGGGAPPPAAKAPSLTIGLAPVVTPKSASMGVVGTF